MSEHQQREQRLMSIEERLARLEQTSDTNTAVFSDSLQIAEICIQALQRAFDDNLVYRLKTIELEPEKTTIKQLDDGCEQITTIPAKLGVDWKAYMRGALTQHEAAAKAAPAGEIATQLDAVVFEFGG